MKAETQLKILEDWISGKGYTLQKHRKLPDELFMKEKKIVLCTRSTPQNQVYSLLHECRTLSHPFKEEVICKAF